MEAGALFLIVLALLVIVAAGFVVYAIAARLRQKQLHPREDGLEGGESPPSGAGPPTHARVDSEQRTRFVHHR